MSLYDFDIYYDDILIENVLDIDTYKTTKNTYMIVTFINRNSKYTILNREISEFTFKKKESK